MPLDRFVLILVCVVVAAGLTVGAAALLGGLAEMPAAWPVLVPLVLIAAILVRVLVQRRQDPYDRTDRR